MYLDTLSERSWISVFERYEQREKSSIKMLIMATDEPSVFKQTAFTVAASLRRHERELRESEASAGELAENSASHLCTAF